MPKYVIERNMPGAGALSETNSRPFPRSLAVRLRRLERKSSGWKASSPRIRVYSVYIARDERLIREHASSERFAGGYHPRG